VDEGRQFSPTPYACSTLAWKSSKILCWSLVTPLEPSGFPLKTSTNRTLSRDDRFSINSFFNVSFETDHSVRAHIEKNNLLAKELSASGYATDELSTINCILTTLPNQFLGFFTSWESTDLADRTMANLTTRLCNEEERNKKRHSKVKSKGSDNKVFFGQPSHQSSPQHPNPGSSHRNAFRVNSNPFNRDSARLNSSPYPQKGGREGRRRVFCGGRTSGSGYSRFFYSNQGNKRRNGRCWYCD
jgi:hypothetical protein